MTGVLVRWRLYLGVRRHLIRARRVELAQRELAARVADMRNAYMSDLVRARSIDQARARAAHPSTRDHCNPHGLPRPEVN